MRIRVWNAFAGNNSGSYTIVGSFPTDAAARDVAAALAPVMAAHHAFMNTEDGKKEGEPPFHTFLRAEGLALADPGIALEDDWPAYGSAPEVIAVGPKVVLYVDYTVTMPRAIGEVFYRRGGRVDIELDHAHHHIISTFHFWVEGGYRPAEREAARARLRALQTALGAILPPLLEWPAEHQRRPIEPAWHDDGYGIQLGAVFPDLVRGVSAVSAAAAEHGARVHLRVQEEPWPARDPLAFLRGLNERERGPWQAVLWEVKDNRVAALKAVREIAGLSLAEARERLAEAPCVVLDHATQEDAEEAAAKLRAAGADAEAVRPRAGG